MGSFGKWDEVDDYWSEEGKAKTFGNILQESVSVRFRSGYLAIPLRREIIASEKDFKTCGKEGNIMKPCTQIADF